MSTKSGSEIVVESGSSHKYSENDSSGCDIIVIGSDSDGSKG
jgi:hypothetical protein